MEKERAIELLQEQIDLIEDIKDRGRHSNEYKEWLLKTKNFINKIYDDENKVNGHHIKQFTISLDNLRGNLCRITDIEKQRKFIEDMENARIVLSSMVDEIKEFWNDVRNEVPVSTPLEKVIKICNKFHIVARQLQSRHDNRETIKITDEYDVQDLLHAILKLEFDDIRPEEWTPSYAGKSARMDFLLKQERIVIEVKKTRETLKYKEVGEQLLSDIQRYKEHPDCDCLVCFVYDPDGLIANPRGLYNDLNKQEDGTEVLIIITPKGA